ncbi:hypothetical protein [Saccharospirillum salsuginis]|uniref:Uncharacterized protein n=1 Tax=Saccharospirillum salsuginis TaxID=418750 RepID=A0A918K0V7_9GAMM|nr:hypothetical protein [Saccharospirillum salsuginis]GGX39968.1 hypothetical protein GCM10007392_03170 [Saccharospirillum salsuginis]
MGLDDIATILSGFSTVVIAILTVFLWRENRLLRKAGSEPNLVAYFEPHPDGTGGLNISIANVGTGPARNVYFQFLGESDHFSRYNLILDCTTKRGPITLIPQGEKISILFAIGFQLFNPKDSDAKEPMPPFNVRLEWTSLNGADAKCEDYLLDVKPYADLPGLVNKPYLLKIVDSIDGLGKKVGNLNLDVRNLSNLIEANSLENRAVKKVKGNNESI